MVLVMMTGKLTRTKSILNTEQWWKDIKLSPTFFLNIPVSVSVCLSV